MRYAKLLSINILMFKEYRTLFGIAGVDIFIIIFQTKNINLNCFAKILFLLFYFIILESVAQY